MEQFDVDAQVRQAVQCGPGANMGIIESILKTLLLHEITIIIIVYSPKDISDIRRHQRRSEEEQFNFRLTIFGPFKVEKTDGRLAEIGR